MEILKNDDIWAQEDEAEVAEIEGPWTEMALSLSKRQRKRRRNKRLKDILEGDRRDIDRRGDAPPDTDYAANQIQVAGLRDSSDQLPMLEQSSLAL